MKAIGKELKWALCGFIGGFVLCFFLVNAINKPSQARLTHSNIPPGQMRFSSSDGTIILTQKAAPIVRVENGNWNGHANRPSPVLRNVPPGTLPDNYSVDLIDGRDQTPTSR